MTLIDSLDTLAIMGNVTEFKKAVKLVVDNVSFDKPYTVQVSKIPNILAIDYVFINGFYDLFL